MNNNSQHINGHEAQNNNQINNTSLQKELTVYSPDKKQSEYEELIIKNMQQQANKHCKMQIAKIRQVREYVNAQAKFEAQDFYDRDFLYLVSIKWLQQWKRFVNYKQVINFKNISLFQSHNSEALGCMNEDLIDATYGQFLQFKQNQYTPYILYYNIALNPKIRQNEHFQYCSQQMWNAIKHYPNKQIKREITNSPGSSQKIVDVYLQKITLFFLSKNILKDLKKGELKDIPLNIIQFSKLKLFSQFRMAVTQLILQYLSSYQGIQDMNQLDWDIYFWFFDPSWTTQYFQKRVKFSLKTQSMCSQYTICIKAKPIKDDLRIQQQLLIENPILICEVIHSKITKNRICYNMQVGVFSVCPKCNMQKQLQFRCKCLKMVYCSQNCLNTHTQHIKGCPNYKKTDQKKQINGNPPMPRAGLIGLKNLGNTCFMNSGIQCLSYIQQLTHYFISDAYVADINVDNQLGTKGKLSKYYRDMLKQLWCSNDSIFSPHQFKRYFSTVQRMFSGYQQHDAGEFLCHLLSALHEDINKIKKKPYIQNKDFDERPEAVIAREQWANFLLRQNSKIVDLMYGQFRSQVDCTQCNYKSVQFDPFLMCSLPIPNKTLEYDIQIILQNEEDLSQQRFVFSVHQTYTVRNLIKSLRNQKQVLVDKPLLIYCQKTIILESQLVKSLITSGKKTIYVRALTEYESPNGCNVHISFNTLIKKNLDCKKQQFGQKFYKFKPEITFTQIHHYLYGKYRKYLDVGDYDELRQKPLKERQVKLLVFHHQFISCWLCNKKCQGCQFPYKNQFIEQVAKKKNILCIQYIINTNISKQSLQLKEKKVEKKLKQITLLDCFRDFELSQILNKGEQWRCPRCKNNVRAKKQMMIYKSPKILMLCLKRFKKQRSSAQKNHSFVYFPLKDLDLTEIVMNSELPIQTKPDQYKQKPNQKVLYDLFAVSYHMGQTGGGHYIAACKNSTNGRWFRFDDEKVTPLKQQYVINEQAYILFYKRKQI